ncbi:bifunctional adenosylcobinamide kinase/adenosylcobinamide-phosphate guanylyltransferase [Elusimicrobiota bacterium]
MIILITGGIKSGKSDFVLKLAEKSTSGSDLFFLATALPEDEEMKSRIQRHQITRSKQWKTLEASGSILKCIKQVPQGSTVILDCMTLWIARIICKNDLDKIDTEYIKQKVRHIMEVAQEKEVDLFIVTNEVGWGIIPENKMARIFEDNLGVINKHMAEHADEVYLMVSGISIRIK